MVRKVAVETPPAKANELKAEVSTTSVTVIVIAKFVALPAASVALMVMSYTLFAPTSVGASKFGARLKVITPVLELITTVAESTPPTLLHVTISFAVAVPTEV